MNGPRVIAEAGGVVAVWKPAGLATQAPPGIASAEAWLRRRLHGERDGGNRGGGYLGVPHRLDRGVSGVVLFAATPRAARQLSRQFERRQVRKRYLAIAARGPAGDEAVAALEAAAAEPEDGGVVWCDMLEKIPDEARARIVAAGAAGGREAVSIARLVGGLPGGRLLLDLRPVTGRMHQLRLQAAARGLPVLGDDLYGLRGQLDRDWSARVEAARSGAERTAWADAVGGGAAAGTAAADAVRPATLALHAARIEYTDPDGGNAVAIDADLPDYWPPQAVAAALTPRP